MSMNYYPSCADVIEEDFIKEQCPNEFDIFINSFQETEFDLDNFAYEMDIDSYSYSDEADKDIRPVLNTYENLCTAFEKKTGLSLYIGYHDHENCGDRGDDVNGVYWFVKGARQLTEAGEKYKDKIKHARWVVLG